MNHHLDTSITTEQAATIRGYLDQYRKLLLEGKAPPYGLQWWLRQKRLTSDQVAFGVGEFYTAKEKK